MTKVAVVQVQYNPRICSFLKLDNKESAVSQAGFEAAYLKDDFKPVPNNIHMVWVGAEPGTKQADYLRQWAKKNPQHTIMLWVDSSQFTAYSANKAALAKAETIYPSYQAERPLRGLFSQLKTTLEHPSGPKHSVSRLAENSQALKELNKELAVPGNEQLKVELLAGAREVTAYNAPQVLDVFARHASRTDDKFYQAEATILDQTTKAWDQCSRSPLRDVGTLVSVQKRFEDLNNVQVRDLSNSADIRLQNNEAYQHEIVGRNGGYAAASDIARYEIVGQYGGTYTDIDLECVQNLDGALHAHPDLMLVGLIRDKKATSFGGTPYFANALFSSHPGSAMIAGLVDHIGRQYGTMKGNEFVGERYFSRPNKCTIEITGPNALRSHVDRVIKCAQGEPHLVRDDVASLSDMLWDKDLPQNQGFWRRVESHFKFPDSYVNFETEEQQNSATKAMAGGASAR